MIDRMRVEWFCGVMEIFKILSHPTLGTKAVKSRGWSWWGFWFYAFYFLAQKDLKRVGVQLAILLVGVGGGVALMYLFAFTPLGFFFNSGWWTIATPLAMWIHGGLRGLDSKLENLISQGYETVFEAHANNANHALAQYEKSKQSA